MEKFRAFISINLSSPIQINLSRIQERLKRSGADVKWVSPEKIHLTLKFLGDIEEEKKVGVREVMRQVAGQNPSFRLSFSQLGAFPRPEYPRVIWVGVKEGKESLVELNRNLEKELSKYGFPREKREFQPHLTLGRVRSGRNKDKLIQALKDTEASEIGSMIANKIFLMKSTLHPQGAEYEVVEEINLLHK